MRRSMLMLAAAAAMLVVATADTAGAIEWNWRCRNHVQPWHGSYYSAAWGAPVAQVVPPTAESQTHWGWGVGNTRVTPICPQFGRNWPGPGRYDHRMFRPTPPWPSDTNQFGFYYIRGPW